MSTSRTPFPGDVTPRLLSPAPGADPAERLTREERVAATAAALRALAAAGDGDERDGHLERVVELNMGVARAVARRYRNRGIADDDLDQVAFLALVRAARQFDVAHRNDFLSYAVPTIRGELKKHFRDHGWSVRPPRRIQELQGRISGVTETLTQRLGHSPRPSDVARELDVDVEEVIEALATDGCYRPTSLDLPLDGGDGGSGSLGDLLGSEDNQAAAEARAVLGPLVRTLDERDRRIIRLRYFDQCTQQEIADDIGVTQMHVSRLLTRIHAELRERLGVEDGDRLVAG